MEDFLWVNIVVNIIVGCSGGSKMVLDRKKNVRRKNIIGIGKYSDKYKIIFIIRNKIFCDVYICVELICMVIII